MFKKIAILLLFILISGCNSHQDADMPYLPPFLQELKQSQWEYGATEKILGKRDAYFNRYDVYFDEGISVKYSENSEDDYSDGFKGYYFDLTGNIENILFNNKYGDEIIKGVNFKSIKSEVARIMGKPHFRNSALGIYGYKTEDFYIFFIGGNYKINEISIYPIFERESKEELLKKAIEVCEKGEYSQELAAELTKIFEERWDNCNYSFSIVHRARYSGRSESTGLAYYTDGVKIQYKDNSQNKEAILQIYDNFDAGLLLERDMVVTDKNGDILIEYKSKQDLVFEQEINRIHEQVEMRKKINTEGFVSPNDNIILVYNDDSEIEGINVIHREKGKSDFTIITAPCPWGVKWINDRYFIYTTLKHSTFVYDLLLDKEKLLSRHFWVDEVLDEKMITDLEDVIIEYEFDDAGNINFICGHEDFLNSDWESNSIKQ